MLRGSMRSESNALVRSQKGLARRFAALLAWTNTTSW